jgi:hypothetical protein
MMNKNGNELKPQQLGIDHTAEWVERNIPYDKRILDLVEGAPYTASQLVTLREAGVMTPVFANENRAYTIEASPEYIDAVYTLNPSSLSDLKIGYILLDSKFYNTYNSARRQQIDNPDYFNIVYQYPGSNDTFWKRVYQVDNKYLESSDNARGTLSEMKTIFPESAKVYIDEWKDVDPWNSLRKSVIFTLKDWQPYLIWGPGVYLNVDTFVSTRVPLDSGQYDYLVMFRDNNPEGICKCKTELVWQGVRDNIKVWKRVI